MVLNLFDPRGFCPRPAASGAIGCSFGVTSTSHAQNNGGQEEKWRTHGRMGQSMRHSESLWFTIGNMPRPN
jgi:hypothetical protein